MKEEMNKVLKEHEGDILRSLAYAGMAQLGCEPFTYQVPNKMKFDCDGALDKPISGHDALCELANGAYADVEFSDNEIEGVHGSREHVTMKVTAPFAQKINAAIADYQAEMMRTGKGYCYCGHFYKVA